MTSVEVATGMSANISIANMLHDQILNLPDPDVVQLG